MNTLQLWNDDIDFFTNWQLFSESIETYLQDQREVELVCEEIRRKISRIEYSNQNEASYYAFMGSILCYFFYDKTTLDSDLVWACKNGKRFIKMALKYRPQDEEFKVLSFTFDLIELSQTECDVQSYFDATQYINRQCPAIESISDTLIKNDFLRDWYNTAYYMALYKLSWESDVDYNISLKIEVATALKNSSAELFQLMALYMLADANYDMGNFGEAERYAILGKDRLGNINEYQHTDTSHFLWGLCWTIYAQCQEKAGDIDFAFTLYEKGANLGIPKSMIELAKIYEHGLGEEKDIQKAQELFHKAELIKNGEI